MEDNSLSQEQQKSLDEVKEQVAKAMDTDFVEDLIKSNKSEFTHNDIKYRLCKMNYEQKQEVYRERVKKFTMLLKDKAYSLEKDLKKDYLERGIDIDAMTKKVQALEKQKDDLLLKLGEQLKKDAPDNDCEVYKKEIEKINEEQKNLALEKQTLLEFTLENQVLVHMYNYMTYIASEKQVGEAWVKAFKTFDEFQKTDDDILISKLAFLVTMSFQDVV